MSITSASEPIPLIWLICVQKKKETDLSDLSEIIKGVAFYHPLAFCRTEVVFQVNRGGPVLGRPWHRGITNQYPESGWWFTRFTK